MSGLLRLGVVAGLIDGTVFTFTALALSSHQAAQILSSVGERRSRWGPVASVATAGLDADVMLSADGAVVFQGIGSYFYGGASIAHGVVYVGDTSGNVLAFSGNGQRWSRSVTRSRPADQRQLLGPPRKLRPGQAKDVDSEVP